MDIYFLISIVSIIKSNTLIAENQISIFIENKWYPLENVMLKI